MAVEVCSYRLALRGVPVGTHVLRTEELGQATLIEGRMMLQGSLGDLTTTQTSRSHRRRFHSLGYREDTTARGERRTFDVTFDAESGLVRASRGHGDDAAVPYLRPYRDPLGLLHELRRLGEAPDPVRVPMLGKDVTVLYLGRTSVETALGQREALAYELHPGRAYVYVDTSEPHPILHMTQLLEGQVLDALLTRISEEEAMPEREAERSKGQRKRRRRRRRRR